MTLSQMALSQVTIYQDGKQRLKSTSAWGRDYYPQVDELVAASAECFKLHTGKLTKDWLPLFSSYLKPFDEKLDSITEIPFKNVPNATLEPVSSPRIQSSSWVEVVKKTIE